jgi:hypothetical protein
MQVLTDEELQEPLDVPSPEEQRMTFQIAMVGCDGLVIGSDRRAQYAESGIPRFPQPISQQKFFVSESQSITCFAAGGVTAINLARKITIDCDLPLGTKGASESEWMQNVYAAAATPPDLPPNSLVSQGEDEILIVRRDVTNAFWLLLRRPRVIPIPTITKVMDRICTGCKTAALFLPAHLWTRDMNTHCLQKLATLTLSYATQEDPSSVGPPFDIMTLDNTGHITWSENEPIHENFQVGLERLFAEYGG